MIFCENLLRLNWKKCWKAGSLIITDEDFFWKYEIYFNSPTPLKLSKNATEPAEHQKEDNDCGLRLRPEWQGRDLNREK